MKPLCCQAGIVLCLAVSVGHAFAHERMTCNEVPRETVQQARASVAKAQWREAQAVNKLVPGTYSRAAMEQFRLAYQLESLKAERQHAGQRPAGDLELAIAQTEHELTRLALEQAQRFPPGAISEAELRELLRQAREAAQRVKQLATTHQQPVAAEGLIP